MTENQKEPQNFGDALSATTHLENTRNHYAIQTRREILRLTFELKKIGISEATYQQWLGRVNTLKHLGKFMLTHASILFVVGLAYALRKKLDSWR